MVICMVQKQLADKVGVMTSEGDFVALNEAHLGEVKVLLREYSASHFVSALN